MERFIELKRQQGKISINVKNISAFYPDSRGGTYIALQKDGFWAYDDYDVVKGMIEDSSVSKVAILDNCESMKPIMIAPKEKEKP
jgi:hypothetical protein